MTRWVDMDGGERRDRPGSVRPFGTRRARAERASTFDLTCVGIVIEWRGPAPFHFVAIVGDPVEDIRDRAADASYGWGMVPVSCRIGATGFTTSMWPKDGGYLLPLKDLVRSSESIELGDIVTVDIAICPR